MSRPSGGALSIASSFDVSAYSSANTKYWEFENNVSQTDNKAPSYSQPTDRRSSAAPSVLDGLPIQDPEDFIIEDKTELGTKHVFCIYFSLILFFITAISIVATALYMELEAYSKDEDWNQIVHGTKAFPKVKGETYFAAKKLWEADKVFVNVGKNETQFLTHHFHRNQKFETTGASLCLIFLVVNGIHLLFFIFWGKMRKKFNITSILYGIFGCVLFGAAVFIALSTLVNIPRRLLFIRLWLEDGQMHFLEYEEDHHADFPMRPMESSHEKPPNSKHTRTPSCDVPDNLDFSKELKRLHKVIKICAYRYSKMNPKDECNKNKKTLEVEIEDQTYDVHLLEKLTICSKDGYKLHGFLLLFLASFLCWFAAWLASYANKSLAPKPDISSKFKASLANAIDDIASRAETDVPPDMRIEMPQSSFANFLRSTGVSPRESGPTPSCMNVVPHPGHPALQGRESVLPSLGMSSSAHSMSMDTNIMNVAPNMVIHPPGPLARAKNSSDHSHKSFGISSWFKDSN